jgi:hypothetical protein
VQAVKAALSTLLNPRRGFWTKSKWRTNPLNEKDRSVGAEFRVAMEVWAPSEVLVAYSQRLHYSTLPRQWPRVQRVDGPVVNQSGVR